MYVILTFIMLVILSYFVAKFIFYTKLEHQDRKSKTINNNNLDNNMPAFNEALKTYQISNFIYSDIKAETKIQSNLILFELIFFFNFLEKITFNIKKVSSTITKDYTPMLNDLLNHENKTDYQKYKDRIEAITNSRIRIYWGLMRKYSTLITPAFINDAFCFLAELINYIRIYNDFMEIDYHSYIHKDKIDNPVDSTNIQKIYEILNSHYKQVINFLPKETTEN